MPPGDPDSPNEPDTKAPSPKRDAQGDPTVSMPPPAAPPPAPNADQPTMAIPPTTRRNAEPATRAEGVGQTTDDREFLPGVKRIGGYTVHGVVGVGGMGVVYRAEQTSPRRIVALKVIRPGLVSPSLMRRFEHEAQVLGRLQHPGIAAIHQAGAADTPAGVTPYFAMEFVEGRELAEYLREEKPSRARIAELFARICEAVQHAHTKGVIHRDLKPSNVLVDQSDQPKILDFGVARATDADIQAVTIETSAGTLIGTVPYMSPEQIAGDPNALDTRSDVYTLGVLLFEALAGRLPHDLRDATIIEAARTITDTEPKSLAAVDASLKGDLSTIVDKALEKDRERRYQSAAELGADLRRFIADEPISARPPSTLYVFQKFARRNKAFVAASVVVVAALVGVAAAAVGAAIYRNHQFQQAERMADFIGEIFLAPDPARLGRGATLFDVLRDRASMIDQEFADRPHTAAELHERFGETLYRLGYVQEARDEFVRALELFESTVGPNADASLFQINNLAVIDRHLGDLDGATERLRDLIARRENKSGDQRRELSLALDNLGENLRLQRQLDEAEQAFLDAIELRELVVADPPPGRAELRRFDRWRLRQSKNNLALTRLTAGRFREAHDDLESLLAECLEAERAEGGERNGLTLTVMQNLGLALDNRGRLEQAIELQRQAHAGHRDMLGDSHARTLVAGATLAKSLGFTGRFDEARSILLPAIERADSDEDLGPDHAVTRLARLALAGVLRREGRTEEALTLAQGVADAMDSGEGSERVREECGVVLGRVLLDAGEAERAVDRLEPVAASLLRTRGPGHWRTAETRCLLAAALRAAGREQEGDELAASALTELTAALTRDHWRVREARTLLGLSPDAP